MLHEGLLYPLFLRTTEGFLGLFTGVFETVFDAERVVAWFVEEVINSWRSGEDGEMVA